jgi:DNA-binding transcriptional regulator YiaG
MANIGSLLKQEIVRLARKEVRAESASSKRAASTHRKQLSELKRRMQQLEREVSALRKQSRRATTAAESDNEGTSLRFRAAGFAQHRKRLGLSAREVGQLIGASTISVYKWEQGKARPRAEKLQAIAELRKMGKREAMRKLAEVSE